MEPTLEAPVADLVVDQSTTTDQPITTSTTAPLIEDELLVEEISIDGMCGVY